MRKAFIDEISNRFGIKRTDLLEKDILLSRIDENDFHAFLGNLTNLLKEITEALPK